VYLQEREVVEPVSAVMDVPAMYISKRSSSGSKKQLGFCTPFNFLYAFVN
jgi:hypothetical protein